MKYIITFILATIILNAEYKVEKISNINEKVFSIASTADKVFAGTNSGLYHAQLDDINNWKKNAFYNSKVTMIRKIENELFAGVNESGTLKLYNTEINNINWVDDNNTTFGIGSNFYASDMIMTGGYLLLSLRGTENYPGGYTYSYDIKNKLWEKRRNGSDYYALVNYYYFDFFDFEIFRKEIFVSSKILEDNFDTDTDGSILRGINSTDPAHSTDFNIYSLVNIKDSLLIAGGEVNPTWQGALFKTTSTTTNKVSGWEHIKNFSSRPIKSLEIVDTILFVGNDVGDLFFTVDYVNFEKVQNLPSMGSINELHYNDSLKKLFIAADNGLFYIDLADAEKKYKLDGWIEDCDTEINIKDVEVKLFDVSNSIIGEFYTDYNGKFIINNLEAGTYYLEITKNEYKSIKDTIEIVDIYTYHNCLTSNNPINFNLKGNISDCDSKQNLQGVKVEIKTPYLTKNTDTNGNFEFSDMDPGTYQIEFSKSGHDSKDTTITLPKDSIVNICMNEEIIDDTTKYNLNIIVKDSCSGNQIPNVEVKIAKGSEINIDTSNINGECNFVFNNAVSNLILTTNHEKYYPDTLYLSLDAKILTRTISLFPNKYKPSIEMKIVGDKSIFFGNDTVKISTKFSDSCKNPIIDKNDVQLYVEYNPIELYLLNKDFSENSFNQYYSENLNFEDELQFLPMLGSEFDTEIILHYDAYVGNPKYEHHRFDTLIINKQLPFKLQQKAGGIIKNVSPNPIDKLFTLDYEIFEEGIYYIEINNSIGEKLFELIKSNLGIGVGKIEKIVDLPQGAYFITLRSYNSVDIYPIIVK